jgi:hypothetical protein
MATSNRQVIVKSTIVCCHTAAGLSREAFLFITRPSDRAHLTIVSHMKLPGKNFPPPRVPQNHLVRLPSIDGNQDSPLVDHSPKHVIATIIYIDSYHPHIQQRTIIYCCR